MDNRMDEQLNKALEELMGSLTDEQKEKARTCETRKELLELIDGWGVELPEAVLDEIAGGYPIPNLPQLLLGHP